MATQILAFEQKRQTSTENPRKREGFFVECSAKKESDLLFVFFFLFFSIGIDGPLRVRHLATAHRMP